MKKAILILAVIGLTSVTSVGTALTHSTCGIQKNECTINATSSVMVIEAVNFDALMVVEESNHSFLVAPEVTKNETVLPIVDHGSVVLLPDRVSIFEDLSIINNKANNIYQVCRYYSPLVSKERWPECIKQCSCTNVKNWVYI